MSVHRKKLAKVLKLVFSRIGSMVIFTSVTSFIIFSVTMNDQLDELANSITFASKGKISSNILDDQSTLSPVIAPTVEKRIINVEQLTPFDTQEEFSPYLDEGQVVIYPGMPGKIVTQYEHVVVNGKVMKIDKIANKQINARPKKIFIGIRKPFTSYGTPVDLDEYGCPTKYDKVLSNRVATAYTADYGARTSTNKVPQLGYVAVNPKVIPYHTVMFIKCLNSDFSGIFIAEDTGGAMRQGHADIDIFMLTEAQCRIFGRQKIDIYLLSKK